MLHKYEVSFFHLILSNSDELLKNLISFWLHMLKLSFLSLSALLDDLLKQQYLPI